MTNKELLKIAMAQSAVDSGCEPEDFLAKENKVVLSKVHPDARRYLNLPFVCDLTSYGNNIVASVAPELSDTVADYISRFPVEHCFETPNLHVLMNALRPMGYDICFMAEYWLPDLDVLKPIGCAYDLRILTPGDFVNLYRPEWSNALCEKRKQLDILGVGAYDGEELVGFAGCSMDCDTMWQIGVDVLPAYRKQGIASAVTSTLACEIVKRGKVPFYCCAWSNIPSARNAIRSGFRPAWVTVTAKPIDEIEKMNNG